MTWTTLQVNSEVFGTNPDVNSPAASSLLPTRLPAVRPPTQPTVLAVLPPKVKAAPATLPPTTLPPTRLPPTRLPPTSASAERNPTNSPPTPNGDSDRHENHRPLGTARLLTPTTGEEGSITGYPTTEYDELWFEFSINDAFLSLGEEKKSSVANRTISMPLDQRYPLSPERGLKQEQSIAEPLSPITQNFQQQGCTSCQNEFDFAFYGDFSPTPIDQASMYPDAHREAWVYDCKYNVPTQYPWIEWGRIFYGDGITPRGRNWFGSTNLVRPEFYVYGDFRSGILVGRNALGRSDNWANRLNLDMDLKITDTERLHSFIGPIDNGSDFTRLQLVDGELQYRQEFNLTPFTGFFEGDVGSMLGGLLGGSSPFELPFTLGLIPLLFQNGIWMEDAVTGAAFSLPARHSRLLNWSNYDATFFAVFDQINSPAFGNDKHAAQAFGTAWFIEAYGGYIESGYAYVRDRNLSERSYHNTTTSFTRRYFDRISNSVRVIINAGQELPEAQRTADGVLLLVENSWITASPLTFVPYANFFVGWNRPQSVARAGISGGILRNTGINFDTDGVNGLATLDASGSDTAGGAIGIDLLGSDLDRQLLLEAAYLTPHGSQNAAVPGDQFALGARFQIPLTNATLWRFDTMYGWRRGLQDVYGTRMEYRWKF